MKIHSTIDSRIALLSIILTVVVLGGCFSNLPKDLPVLYPCSIEVIQDGVPLVGASITLEFTDESRPADGQIWIPLGRTDASGQAKIVTNGRYLGAPSGKYKVIVSKGVSGESRFGPPPPEGTPQYGRWVDNTSNESLREYTLVDPKFLSGKTSPLEVEVKKGGKNFLSADVGKAVKIPM